MTVTINLGYEHACVLLETLEDLIAIESEDKREPLLEIYSILLSDSLKVQTENDSSKTS